MFEWLAQYSPKELIGLAGTVGGILFLMVTVASAQWASVKRAEFRSQQAEQELALKQQMIDRGMTADEIAKVLAAGLGNPGSDSHCKKRRAEEPASV